MSYKSKKKKALPKSNWDVVPNTHEALVDRYIFESVQNNVKRTIKSNITNRDKRLFENLLYCKECGNTVIGTQGILEEECVSHILVHMIN